MIVTKKFIPRRTMLRGIGATLALPLLDGMVPALTALSQTAAKPVRRFAVVYLPNGANMAKWVPTTTGRDFELSPILQPLAAFRDNLTIVSGLANKPAFPLPYEPSGFHARCCAAFLTGVHPKWTQGPDIEVGVSMDQIAAKEFGQQTQLASLELTVDLNDLAGACDLGYSCAYVNTVAWRGPKTPLPTENNPRTIFERLFGDSGSTDAATRLRRNQKNRSVLDSVTEKVAGLQKGLGPRDRFKLSEYLDAVRDVERRIQIAEEQNGRELLAVDQPAGIPSTLEAHAKLMYDLQVLAFQADLTRVTTFMMGREQTQRTFPEIGVPDAHHSVSHHQRDPIKLEKEAKINTYHASLYAHFVERLRSTPDGDGSLFDHSTLFYGAGMGDSDQHSPLNPPIALLGGSGSGLKGGQHLHYQDAPLSNLFATLLEKLGLPGEGFGDSTGTFAEL